jgi:hypothetical protein
MTRKNVAYERARKKDAQEQQQRRPRRSSTSGPALLFAKVEVDSTKMGHVIGKSGETIKRITQEAGPNCSIWNKRGTNTFFLKAPIQATLDTAVQMIQRQAHSLEDDSIVTGFQQRGGIRDLKRQRREERLLREGNSIPSSSDTQEAAAAFSLVKGDFPDTRAAAKKQKKQTKVSFGAGRFSLLVNDSDSDDTVPEEEATPALKTTPLSGPWANTPAAIHTDEPKVEMTVSKPSHPPTILEKPKMVRHFTQRMAATATDGWGDSSDEEEEDNSGHKPDLLPASEYETTVWA